MIYFRRWVYCAFCLLALASCSNKDYVDVVPFDAKAVVRIQSTERFKDILGDTFSATLSTLSGGLDFSQPLYGFVTNQEYLGVVAQVKEPNALALLLTGTMKKSGHTVRIEQKNDLWWTEAGGWQIAWSDQTLLVLGPGLGTERSAVRKIMQHLFDKDTESFQSTVAGHKLETMNGMFRCVINLDVMPTPYNLLFRMGMPENVDPADVQLFASLEGKEADVKKKNLTLHCELQSDNSEVLNAYKAAALKAHTIKGSFLSSVPKGTFLWFCTNADGNSLLTMLRKDKTIRSMLAGINTGIDLDLMLKSIKGDVVVSIPSLQKSGLPNYLLMADLAKKDFLNDVAYWKQSVKNRKSMTLTNAGNGYLLKTQEISTYFGVNDNMLYFTSSEGLIDKDGKSLTEKLPDVVTKSASKTFLNMYLDVDALLAQPVFKGNNSGAVALLRNLFMGASSLHFVATDLQHSQLIIQCK